MADAKVGSRHLFPFFFLCSAEVEVLFFCVFGNTKYGRVLLNTAVQAIFFFVELKCEILFVGSVCVISPNVRRGTIDLLTGRTRH